MDRSREARKVSTAAPAGLARRRHRGSGFRDSPEDGPVEMPGTARPRDRKKERERERERDRERERESRNKRRRGDRLTHAGAREGRPEESTDESLNDDEEEDYEDEVGGGGSLRMLPPNPASTSSPTVSNQHQIHQRRSFPQTVSSTKMFRPASPWNPADELIGAHVPRKPRSASTKRAHECWVSSPGGIISGDKLHRQASTSPVRSSMVSAAASPSRISPSSSTISSQKKQKPIGANKHRNPSKASASKTPSSNQDEIEFEIAEVLYGLGRQPPNPSKPEGGEHETPTSDSKSRVSSPVSAPAPNLPSPLLMQNGSSAMVATVPKRKRPRPASYGGEENVHLHSRVDLTSKSDVEQTAEMETISVNLEKNLKSGLKNDIASADMKQFIAEQKADPTKLVRNNWPESKNLKLELIAAGLKDDDVSSTKRGPSGKRFDEILEDNSPKVSELEINGHEKFQIDLMAPPPSFQTSPDRDTNNEYLSAEPKKSVPELEKLMPSVNGAGKTEFASNESRNCVELDQKRYKGGLVEESDVQKPYLSKERFIELQLNNTDNNGGESGLSTVVAKKQLIHKQQQQGQPRLSGVPRPEVAGDKAVHTASSLPPALSMAGWKSGLPPMGYMAPLQGVVSMDGSAVSSSSVSIQPQLLLNQPRPKRCATHSYIARNISYHQQFTRMNPFWPAAAGSAPTLYGANPCVSNVFPSVELHGSNAVRVINTLEDRSPSIFPSSNTSKDKPSHGPNVVETAQGKQILLQQSLAAGAAASLLQGPAFIFPLSQQQAAVAASAMTTNMKNPSAPGAAVPTVNPNSITGRAPSATATMGFNHPSMTANEPQYLAIMQNNPYHFSYPTHAGAPQVLRGAHPQTMPFFNGSFYSPPMLHPSQQAQQSAHGHQISPGQNTGISSGSSSSHKNLQNHSQKLQGNGSKVGSGNLKQNFASSKNRPSQMPLQQQNQHLTEAGSKDSPSTADSRGSKYNLPIHVQNMTRTSTSSVLVGGSTGTVNGNTNGNHHRNGNHSDKKLQQQQQGRKDGFGSMPSHQGFAVGSLNGGGGPPVLDIASMGQNHVILQNFPDATRHSYQVMAVAAQQNKNSQIADEVRKRSGVDAPKVDEERKSIVTRGVLSNDGLSIAFSRSDLDISAAQANNVGSSSTNLKAASGLSRSSGPLLSSSMNTANSLNSQQQQLQSQQTPHQKQQLIQLHKQPQQYMASAANGNTTPVSNGNVFPDHLPTNAAMSAKLRNPATAFQQNVGGGISSESQSSQWKNSACTSFQVPAPVLVSSNSASTKNNYHLQNQPWQQGHMQISFSSGNQKTPTAVQGHRHSSGHQSPSQIVVGSPAAISNYKNGGSPKTTTAMMVANKAPQATALSPSASLQVKDSSMPSQSSSSPSSARSASSHGNSNIGISQGNSGSKPQMLHQQQQQMKPQLSKPAMQQTQTVLPSDMQTSQGPSTSSTPSSLPAANGGNHLRRRPETQSLKQSQSPCGSSSVTSRSSFAGAVTSDPAKAIVVAAAAGNGVKAPSHRTSNLSVVQPTGQQQHLPSSFGYMHVAPAGVQAKPAQQK